jgi:hypothetical protein
MLNILGRPRTSGKGPTRREILQAGGAGLFGLSLPKLWSAEARPSERKARAKSVIFLFLFGGPSQLETFDMKPDAPSGIRGPFKPIVSRTPGLRICELLPGLARISDRFCVVRTMSHTYNDHSGAGHYLQTGKRWHVPVGGGFDATPRDWPSVGSVIEYVTQHSARPGPSSMPPYAVVPNRLGRLEQSGQYLRPGEYAGWLGRAYNPLTTVIDKRNSADNPYWRDCTDSELKFTIDGLVPPGEVAQDRSRSRLSLLGQFDAVRRSFEDQPRVAEFDRVRRRALSLATSDAVRRALDIRREPGRLRDRYGRHLLGQSCLLARRLVEAGTRFVTVHYDACDGYSWDSHVHSDDVRNHLLPTFDQAMSALVSDLDDRGMLHETLVVAVGEMGRTPHASPRGGRGHWSTLFPAVLAGGGVRGGSLYGRSDKDAAYPVEDLVSPEDLAATLYHALGIDPGLRIPDAQGRPTSMLEEGKPIRRIFG